MQLVEESLPPEVRFFNHLMSIEDDAEIEQLLQQNRNMVTERLIQFMEEAETNMRETDSEETAERVMHVREIVKRMQG